MSAFLQIMQIIQTIPSAITAVQTAIGRGNGAIKEKHVEQMVADSLNIAELVTQQDIVDERGFRSGVKKVIAGVVQIIKSTRWGRGVGF